jgi:undecaprenyl-diphosphatase
MLARLAEAFATYDWLLFVAIGIGGAIFMASRAEWGELTLWLGGTVGGVIFSDVLKFFLTEPRPTTADSLDLQMFWEFPSGHALGSVVCAGLIFFFITKRSPSSRGRISALILLVLAVAIVSFNRMFVGSHYLGDIIAGYAAGITWLGICLMSYMGLAKPKDLGWEANTQ